MAPVHTKKCSKLMRSKPYKLFIVFTVRVRERRREKRREGERGEKQLERLEEGAYSGHSINNSFTD